MSDLVKAEALRIAYEELKRLGHRFGSEDIGAYASRIIKRLNEEPTNDR